MANTSLASSYGQKKFYSEGIAHDGKDFSRFFLISRCFHIQNLEYINPE
jgi:hypothetical protein